MVIYKISNTVNGKLYIGQTTGKLGDRWADHKRYARQDGSRQTALYSAMRKHGIENFHVEQIDSATTLDELNIKEETYIKALNTVAPNGYNLELGGKNKMCHAETREKIAASLKGRPIKNRMNGAPKGRPVSEERRQRISETMTGVAQPWKYKAVIAVETGTVYESVNAAAEMLGVSRVTISGLLKSGKQSKKLGLSFRLMAESK